MSVLDTITDSDGDQVEVSESDGTVFLTVYGVSGSEPTTTGCVALGAELRDRFAKAWAEAERRAEVVARAVTPGQVSG